MREEEEYKREVIVITIERDNKRLLDIYRKGEEKDTLSERAFNNIYDRVEYALSASSLMEILDEVPTLEESVISEKMEWSFRNSGMLFRNKRNEESFWSKARPFKSYSEASFC